MADTNTDQVTLTVPRNQMRLIEAWGVHETDRIHTEYAHHRLTDSEYASAKEATATVLATVREARGGI